MSNVFWKPKTKRLYLDSASQTWYIVHKTAFTPPYSIGAAYNRAPYPVGAVSNRAPYPVGAVSNRAGFEKENSQL